MRSLRSLLISKSDATPLLSPASAASRMRLTADSPNAECPCPRCHTPRPRLTLLTSMVRYFACGACGYSWNESREETEAPRVARAALEPASSAFFGVSGNQWIE